MIRVVDPTQFPAFPAGQGNSQLANAINEVKKYNNVSLITVAGTHDDGFAIVDLGVNAVDCDFSVVGLNSCSYNLFANELAGAGSDNTHYIHPDGRLWYKSMPIQGTGRGDGIQLITALKCHSNIRDIWTAGIGKSFTVFNTRTGTWATIDSYSDEYTAAVTVFATEVGYPGGVQNEDDVFEFYSNPANICAVGNITTGQWLACDDYDTAHPEQLIHPPFAPAAVPGDLFSGGSGIANPFDYMHPPSVYISPPSDLDPIWNNCGSAVDGRLQVRSTSEFQLKYLVRWRT